MESLTKEQWSELDEAKRREKISSWMNDNNVKREKIPRFELTTGTWGKYRRRVEEGNEIAR